jgi:hypothetical protein
MSTTTDPNDPELGHGIDTKTTPMHEKYLVLSAEERRKGFVRPVRQTYKHAGVRPKNPLRELTQEEKDRYPTLNYVMFEAYPHDEGSSITGRYWTQAQLDNRGCGCLTTMAMDIAETYARNPKFYGSTFCVQCQMHLAVEEFTWEDGSVVGS